MFNVTVDNTLVIYVMAHKCAGCLMKKDKGHVQGHMVIESGVILKGQISILCHIKAHISYAVQNYCQG